MNLTIQDKLDAMLLLVNGYRISLNEVLNAANKAGDDGEEALERFIASDGICGEVACDLFRLDTAHLDGDTIWMRVAELVAGYRMRLWRLEENFMQPDATQEALVRIEQQIYTLNRLVGQLDIIMMYHDAADLRSFLHDQPGIPAVPSALLLQ